MLSSKTLPGSSLRARCLTALPHPTPPPNPGSKRPCSQARKPLPFPLPSLPFPSPSHPSARYLSTYLPTLLYLSTYPSIYLSIYLSTYTSTYLPTSLPPAPFSLPSRQPAPGPVYQLPLPIPFPRPFFFPLLAPSPPRSKPRFFSYFPFFMLIRRDSNPSPLCLPVHYQFNAYANCAIPARLQIQWFFCMLFICKSTSCP